MKLWAGLVILMALLNGCESMGGKKEKREQLTVACSGNEHWVDCDTKAKRLCQNGYDVARKDESIVQQRRIMTLYCN